MLDSLAAGDGTCDLAVAGVDVTTPNVERGIEFSLPTMQGGYKLMVCAHGQAVECSGRRRRRVGAG